MSNDSETSHNKYQELYADFACEISPIVESDSYRMTKRRKKSSSLPGCIAGKPVRKSQYAVSKSATYLNLKNENISKKSTQLKTPTKKLPHLI